MLENIEIIDYKCFKNFKLESLSQINVISGGNNVGKTALLEALFLESYIFDNDLIGFNFIIGCLYNIAKNRNISMDRFSNYLEKINLSLKSNNHKVNLQYKSHYYLDKEEKEKAREFNQDYSGYLVYNLNDEVSLYSIKDITIHTFYKTFINSSKPLNKYLVQLYSNIQTQGIQHKFLKYLQTLDKNIEWLEPQLIDEELLLRVNLKNPEHSLISSELGEGTNRYIEIIATLLSNNNKSIFIDEIENGIHYSKLKDIWKTIIEIVQKENKQLFVTTHDEDIIKALIEASEESNYEDVSSIQLYKDDTNTIVPIVLQYKNFAYGINRGADVR